MLRSRRIHYAWVVAATAFVALVMSAGFRSASGVLLIPLHDDFGWSHETISLAVFLNLLCFGLGAPFAAALVERVGIRRVVTLALATIAVSALLTTRMTEPWHLFVLWGVVNGFATGAVSVPLAAIVANRWFVERRGLVTGILSASNASGQLVFLPLLAWLTEFDWRYAAVAVAGTALLVVLPIVVAFMRDRPEHLGVRPFGAGPEWAPTAAAPTLRAALDGLRTAVRTRTFWLLAATFFICGATTNGLVSTHLIPAAHDHGIPEVTAAGLLALVGVFDIVGTTASGWLTDRFPAARLLVVYYGLRGLSLLALPLAFDAPHATLLAFAVVYGLDWVATVPPTVALTADAFGRERVGVVFGWIFAAHQLGAATAAWAAGAARTGAGDYAPAFLVAGAIALIAAALALLLRSRPAAALAAAS